MPLGPGKYDDLLTTAREAAKAQGGILIIIEGETGAGFACQLEPHLIRRVPAILRDIADNIEKDIHPLGIHHAKPKT